jgi:hypothetical protein
VNQFPFKPSGVRPVETIVSRKEDDRSIPKILPEIVVVDPSSYVIRLADIGNYEVISEVVYFVAGENIDALSGEISPCLHLAPSSTRNDEPPTGPVHLFYDAHAFRITIENVNTESEGSRHHYLSSAM